MHNTSTTLVAGQSLTQKISLREPSNQYRYGDIVAFTNPTIYIRNPNGVQISTGSITVKKI
jgi:hypothetical protein